MAEPVNPYLPDRGQQLATLLMSLGQGFTYADAAGRSPLAGFSLGAGIYGQASHQAQEEAQKAYQWQQNYKQNEDYRRAQEDNLRSQTALREAEAKNKLGMGNAVLAALGPQVPGMA